MEDSTHDVDSTKLDVWRNTRCSNKTRILHGKITPFKGTTCAPALLQECCWCETLTALLESRLLGINEADIRESGNNNRKHMKTHENTAIFRVHQAIPTSCFTTSLHRTFVCPKQLPPRRYLGAAKTSRAWELSVATAWTAWNVGTGTGTPWNTLHWEIMVDRDHGKTMSVVSLKLVHHITSTS